MTPPPGYDDLAGDTTTDAPLNVPGVGVVSVRRPVGASLSGLVTSQRHKDGSEGHRAALARWVADHLKEGEWERLNVWMMTADSAPVDVWERVAEHLATAGTARPYHAVTVLASVAGEHWRSIRTRFTLAGVDPMTLPLHHILDVVEVWLFERTDKPNELTAALYPTRESDGPPAWWSDELMIAAANSPSADNV